MPLSEADIAQLADLGVSQDKIEELNRRMYQAQEMRFGAGPQGRQAGRSYVAANPMEHLAQAIRQFRGGREMGRVSGERGELLDQTARARQNVMLQLLRNQQMNQGQGMPPQQGPPPPPVVPGYR